MDPALAALVGAAVGSFATLIAGTLGPWVRDAANRKAIRAAELRELQRTAVLDVIETFSTVYRTRFLGIRDERLAVASSEAAVAASRLSLVLPIRDLEIEKLLAFSLNLLSNEKAAIGAAAMTVTGNVLHKWYRGLLQGTEIGDEFERQLKQHLSASRES